MNLRGKRIEDADIFFSEGGAGWMTLSKTAAQDVFAQLQSQGRLVSMIEAGIWHNPGFEPRLDGILSEVTKERNGIPHAEAEEYFSDIDPSYDTFIVTVQKSKSGKDA